VLPDPLHPTCNAAGTKCSVAAAGGAGYRVEAQERPESARPTDEAAAARLLLQATFGQTKRSIREALALAPSAATAADAGAPTEAEAAEAAAAVAEAWVADQMSLPPTYHRAHYRRATNPRVPHDPYSAGVAEICDTGSRWNRFALDTFDVGKTLELHSNIQRKRWSVQISGAVRTEVPEVFATDLWPGNKPTTIQSGNGCAKLTAADPRGTVPYMGACADETAANVEWTYNDVSGLITSAHGRCLDRSKDGYVHLWDCSATNTNQLWRYDVATKLIHRRDGT
jgi:hypothetical protein